MLCDRINQFNQNLAINVRMPKEIVVLNPFKDPITSYLSQRFYKMYYSDNKQRTLILGINPGRLGSGLTGVPFTDPINLERFCGIENNLAKKHEISSEYIYEVINFYGGAAAFYKKFYFSSVSPLGFIKDGKNLNYYDVKGLPEKLMNFILANIELQLSWGINREVVYCLGEGKNFEFLQKLNAEHKFFKQIITLAHPRFIMQYKRKKLQEYVNSYISLLV